MNEELWPNEKLPEDKIVPRSRGLSSRTLLNGASAFVIFVVLFVSRPVWGGAVQSAWARFFPPPPYQGQSLYAVTKSGKLYATQATDGKMRWSQNIAAGSSIRVKGTTIYERTQAGVIAAVSTSDGKERWHYRAQEGRALTLSEGDEANVYILDNPSGDSTPGSGSLIALSGVDGHVVWHYDSHSRILPFTVQFLPNLIMLESLFPSALVALRPQDGSELWRFAINQYTASLIVSAEDQGHVSVITNDGLSLLDMQTGKLVWKLDIAVGTMNLYSLIGNVAVFGQAADIQGRQTLVAIDGATQRQRWMTTEDTSYDVLYAQTLDELVLASKTGLLAIKGDDGTTLWRYDLAPPLSNFVSPQKAVLVGQTLYINDLNWAYAIDSQKGTLLWKTRVSGGDAQVGDAATMPLISGDFVYLSNAKEMLALDNDSGMIRWRTSAVGEALAQLVLGAS